MNLIEEDFQKKENTNGKKTSKIILAAIVIVFLIIIAIVIYMAYIEGKTLKLTLDGQVNEKIKKILVFEEDGTIYAPIKEIASYFRL